MRGLCYKVIGDAVNYKMKGCIEDVTNVSYQVKGSIFKSKTIMHQWNMIFKY